MWSNFRATEGSFIASTWYCDSFMLSRAFLALKITAGNSLASYQGIPQGSILSALLCNLYYGEVEYELLKSLVDTNGEPAPHLASRCGSGGHSLAMRLIDDYLFVSTSESEARRFLAVLSSADKKSIFKLNKKKTITNIPGLGQSTHCRDAWFPWCGIEINIHDLSVRPSFRR